MSYYLDCFLPRPPDIPPLHEVSSESVESWLGVQVKRAPEEWHILLAGILQQDSLSSSEDLGIIAEVTDSYRECADQY